MKPFQLYMGPLKGFTDYVFRNTLAAHFGGFDLAVAPFIATKKDNKIKRKYVNDVLPEKNPGLPVIPQILGKSDQDFIILANYLFDMGYGTVNWNLGCPYPMVANKRRGAGMLPYTGTIDRFLDTVIPRLNGKLSIKVRLGWQSAVDLFRLIPVINQYPLAEVIIHPRTGLQRYEGAPDLDAFEQCLTNICHPVVYNGDIRTPDIFYGLARRFPQVNRWMIGRWCIADPFMAQTIKNGRVADGDRIRRLKQFHAALLENYSAVLDGPGHVLNKMKGLWKYLALPFKDFSRTLKKIKKETRTDQYLERVNRFFDDEAQLNAESPDPDPIAQNGGPDMRAVR